jgi:hypothetical protein
MPEVTEDERGRRIFQVKKEMAVETALEKVRQNIGQDWKLYSASDIEHLKYMLGESWVSMDRKKWEGCSFTRLATKHLDEIIHLGKAVRKKEKLEGDAVREVVKILKKVA